MAHGNKLSEAVRGFADGTAEFMQDMGARIIDSPFFRSTIEDRKKVTLGLMAANMVVASVPTFVWGPDLETAKHATVEERINTVEKNTLAIVHATSWKCLEDIKGLPDLKQIDDARQAMLIKSCGRNYYDQVYAYDWSTSDLHLVQSDEQIVVNGDRAMMGISVATMIAASLVASGAMAKIRQPKIRKRTGQVTLAKTKEPERIARRACGSTVCHILKPNGHDDRAILFARPWEPQRSLAPEAIRVES